MTSDKDNGLMTRQEAAQRLRVGLQTLDRRIAQGELECHRLGDGPRAPVRISENQLQRYLEKTFTGQRDEVRTKVRALLEQ